MQYISTNGNLLKKSKTCFRISRLTSPPYYPKSVKIFWNAQKELYHYELGPKTRIIMLLQINMKVGFYGNYNYHLHNTISLDFDNFSILQMSLTTAWERVTLKLQPRPAAHAQPCTSHALTPTGRGRLLVGDDYGSFAGVCCFSILSLFLFTWCIVCH